MTTSSGLRRRRCRSPRSPVPGELAQCVGIVLRLESGRPRRRPRARDPHHKDACPRPIPTGIHRFRRGRHTWRHGRWRPGISADSSRFTVSSPFRASTCAGNLAPSNDQSTGARRHAGSRRHPYGDVDKAWSPARRNRLVCARKTDRDGRPPTSPVRSARKLASGRDRRNAGSCRSRSSRRSRPAIEPEPMPHQTIEMPNQEIGQIEGSWLLLVQRRRIRPRRIELVAMGPRKAAHSSGFEHPSRRPPVPQSA